MYWITLYLHSVVAKLDIHLICLSSLLQLSYFWYVTYLREGNSLQKRLIFISLLVVLIVIIGIFQPLASTKETRTFLISLKNFSVTIDNQLDFDLLTIETGVIKSDSQGNAIGGIQK